MRKIRVFSPQVKIVNFFRKRKRSKDRGFVLAKCSCSIVRIKDRLVLQVCWFSIYDPVVLCINRFSTQQSMA